jgi:hypothetical protein
VGVRRLAGHGFGARRAALGELFRLNVPAAGGRLGGRGRALDELALFVAALLRRKRLTGTEDGKTQAEQQRGQ